MPITGCAYFSHEQKDEKTGEVIGEGIVCGHCNKPLIEEPFMILVSSEGRAAFSHISCERKVAADLESVIGTTQPAGKL